MNDIRTVINIYDNNTIILENYEYEEKTQFAYHLYCNDNLIYETEYSDNNQFVYLAKENGTYKVKVDIIAGDQEYSKYSDTVVIDGATFANKKRCRFNSANAIKSVSREIINNFDTLFRIALFDYRLENRDSLMGNLWNYLNPVMQLGTYWLVFGIGVRNGKDVDGFPYLIWMLVGLIPWFFFSGCLTKGASSIFQKAAVVTKLNYPMSTVPISAIITEGIHLLNTLLILEIVLLAYGEFPTIYYFNLIYYVAYLFILLCSLSLITSVLTMITRDFSKLITNFIRLLFYLHPILWDMSSMPSAFQKIIYYSPVYYVVRGFRDSILYNISFWKDIRQMAFEWLLVIILYALGCILQMKYRARYRDMI